MRLPLVRNLTVMILLAALSGCLGLNDVSRVAEPGYSPTSNRAIVIFGVAAQGDWRPSTISVRLYEYSLEKQSITGNCWRWNKLEASSDATRSGMEYFVFDVAPGFYAGSASASFVFPIRSGGLMFEVPANRIVFLGDFVYKASERRLELQHDIDGAMTSLKKSHPDVRGEVVVAKALPSPILRMFVCAP